MSQKYSDYLFETSWEICNKVGGIHTVLSDADFVGVPMTELSVGQRIEHNRFGPGTILELSGTAPEMKARIRFDAHGEKLLLLKYAKIRPERK